MAGPSSPHTYTFEVAMTCGGCSGAVNRVLGKMDGLEIEKVSWEDKQVIVKSATGQPSFEEVRLKIAKTGKAILKGEDNGVQRWPATEESAASA